MTTRARLQIIIGVLIAVSSALIYERYKPFVEAEDNLVSSVAQYQIFFVLLAALMSLISSSEYVAEDAKAGDLYSDILFGWLLVMVNLIGPGMASAMLLRERLMALRENVAELFGRKKREGEKGGEGVATAAADAMPLDGSERVDEGFFSVGADAGLEMSVIEDPTEVPRAPERPKASPLDEPERAGASGIIGVEFLCCEEPE